MQYVRPRWKVETRRTEDQLFSFWQYYILIRSRPKLVTLHPYFMLAPFDEIKYPYRANRLQTPHCPTLLELCTLIYGRVNLWKRMQWCYSEVQDAKLAEEIFVRHRLYNLNGSLGTLITHMVWCDSDIGDCLDRSGDPDIPSLLQDADTEFERLCSVELKKCMDEVDILYQEYLTWRARLWGDGRLQHELTEYLLKRAPKNSYILS